MSSSPKTISENRVWEITGSGRLPAVDSAESWNLFFYWLKFAEARFPRFLAEILRATRLLVLRRSTRRYLRNASLEVQSRTVREKFSPVVTGDGRACSSSRLVRVPTRVRMRTRDVSGYHGVHAAQFNATVTQLRSTVEFHRDSNGIVNVLLSLSFFFSFFYVRYYTNAYSDD